MSEFIKEMVIYDSQIVNGPSSLSCEQEIVQLLKEYGFKTKGKVAPKLIGSVYSKYQPEYCRTWYKQVVVEGDES